MTIDFNRGDAQTGLCVAVILLSEVIKPSIRAKGPPDLNE